MRCPKLFIALLLACFAGPAATLQQLSMNQMTQAATSIVRARVTGWSARFTGTTIYTHYQLQVSETWKGAAQSEVLLPGGIANGIRQSFPGVPQLQTGTEYVLFLWTSQKTGITHILGMNQGMFSITSQPDGSALASRPRIGEGIFDAQGHPVKDSGIQMPLSAMRALASQ